MSRKYSKQPRTKKGRGNSNAPAFNVNVEAAPRSFGTKEPIRPKTEGQKRYFSAIKASDITFGIGPAGTGKTFVPTALAADMLRNGDIKQIILTRPAVEAGDSMGYLPGELDEKFDPYFAPVKAILEERLGGGFVEHAIKSGKIVTRPFSHMRGHTFKDAFIILDEAQNTTVAQMYLFLMRIGENTKVVIDGDLNQQDVPGRSGLLDGIEKLHDMQEVSVVRFTASEIIRSKISKKIIQRYIKGSEDLNDLDCLNDTDTLPGFINRAA